jgi:hypothetical protein
MTFFKKRIFYLSSTAFFVLVVLFMVRRAYLAPSYNWDMIAYIASALSINHPDPAIYHSLAYSLVKASVPAQIFHSLISSPYRHTVFQNFHAFQEQMPFYHVQPLYILLIYLLYKIGVGPVSATVYISIASYVGIAATAFAWTRSIPKEAKPFIRVATAFLLLTSPLWQISKLSTPDALAIFLLVLGTYFYTRGKRHAMGLAFALSIFARPDSLIFVSLILIYIFFVEQWKVSSAVYLVISVVTYFAISLLAHGYSWHTLVGYTFFGYSAYPRQAVWHFGVISYIKVLDLNTRRMIHSLFAPVFLSLAFLGASVGGNTKFRALLAISVATFVLHFLLFPSVEDRFYVSEYVIIALSAFSVIAKDTLALKRKDPSSASKSAFIAIPPR